VLFEILDNIVALIHRDAVLGVDEVWDLVLATCKQFIVGYLNRGAKAPSSTSDRRKRVGRGYSAAQFSYVFISKLAGPRFGRLKLQHSIYKVNGSA